VTRRDNTIETTLAASEPPDVVRKVLTSLRDRGLVDVLSVGELDRAALLQLS
jgi:hypothetical protein